MTGQVCAEQRMFGAEIDEFVAPFAQLFSLLRAPSVERALSGIAYKSWLIPTVHRPREPSQQRPAAAVPGGCEGRARGRRISGPKLSPPKEHTHGNMRERGSGMSLGGPAFIREIERIPGRLFVFAALLVAELIRCDSGGIGRESVPEPSRAVPSPLTPIGLCARQRLAHAKSARRLSGPRLVRGL